MLQSMYHEYPDHSVIDQDRGCTSEDFHKRRIFEDEREIWQFPSHAFELDLKQHTKTMKEMANLLEVLLSIQFWFHSSSYIDEISAFASKLLPKNKITYKKTHKPQFQSSLSFSAYHQRLTSYSKALLLFLERRNPLLLEDVSLQDPQVLIFRSEFQRHEDQ